MKLETDGTNDDVELLEIRKKKLESIYDKLKSPTKTEESNLNRKPNLLQLNASTFQDFIRNNQRVAIDCYADWCGPCKMIEPLFTKLANTHQNVMFGRLNIDDAPMIATQFQIHAIPLILFFKQGQLVNKLLGLQSYDVLQSYIHKLLH